MGMTNDGTAPDLIGWGDNSNGLLGIEQDVRYNSQPHQVVTSFSEPDSPFYGRNILSISASRSSFFVVPQGLGALPISALLAD
jgi:hypothetical protein